MRIELLTSPGCANAGAARKIVEDCLTTLGIDTPIIDFVGRYPSPTVLVDGVDVMRPEAGAPIGDACRLDLPTPPRIFDALRAAMPSQSAGTPQSVAASAQPERAQSHLDNHPELQGVIVGQSDAIALADCAFGHLLAN